MSFSLKTRIFKLFGHNDKVTDSYKNLSNKGLYERFMESLGEEYDEYTLEGIANLIDNTLVPNKLLLKFLPYAEAQIGAPYIIDDIEIRRKLLRFLIPINKIKGTKPSYETLFRLLGFDVDFYITSAPTILNFNNLYMVVTESGTGTVTVNDGVSNIVLVGGKKIYVQNYVTQTISFTGDARLKRETILDFFKSTYSFDDGNLPGGGTEDINTTFDSPGRRFDMKCHGCSNYIVRLFGSMTLDEQLHDAIFRIIEYVEPINGRLFTVYYNDVILLADDSISVCVDENGDLNYNNSAVPEVSLSLSSEGDAQINDVSIGSYSLDSNGDLIFTN